MALGGLVYLPQLRTGTMILAKLCALRETTARSVFATQATQIKDLKTVLLSNKGPQSLSLAHAGDHVPLHLYP